MEKVLAAIGLIILSVAVVYLNVWLLHWAISLFHPITMTQAWGITIILSVISGVFKGRK